MKIEKGLWMAFCSTIILYLVVLFVGYPIVDLMLELTSIDPLAYHKYFAPASSGHYHPTFTDLGVWVFIIKPALILGVLFSPLIIYRIVKMERLLNKEETYEEFCEEDSIFINFLSCMPSQISDYSKADRDSYLFIKIKGESWKLYKLNSRNQKNWNESQWKAEGNEIYIDQHNDLSAKVSKILNKNAEDLSVKNKIGIMFKLVDLRKETESPITV